LAGEGVILVGDQQDGFFFLEQTDVLKQTHIVITNNQVANTLWY
jgi:hypothetical protein